MLSGNANGRIPVILAAAAAASFCLDRYLNDIVMTNPSEIVIQDLTDGLQLHWAELRPPPSDIALLAEAQ